MHVMEGEIEGACARRRALARTRRRPRFFSTVGIKDVSEENVAIVASRAFEARKAGRISMKRRGWIGVLARDHDMRRVSLRKKKIMLTIKKLDCKYTDDRNVADVCAGSRRVS